MLKDIQVYFLKTDINKMLNYSTAKDKTRLHSWWVVKEKLRQVDDTQQHSCLGKFSLTVADTALCCRTDENYLILPHIY